MSTWPRFRQRDREALAALRPGQVSHMAQQAHRVHLAGRRGERLDKELSVLGPSQRDRVEGLSLGREADVVGRE